MIGITPAVWERTAGIRDGVFYCGSGASFLCMAGQSKDGVPIKCKTNIKCLDKMYRQFRNPLDLILKVPPPTKKNNIENLIPPHAKWHIDVNTTFSKCHFWYSVMIASVPSVVDRKLCDRTQPELSQKSDTVNVSWSTKSSSGGQLRWDLVNVMAWTSIN